MVSCQNHTYVYSSLIVNSNFSVHSAMYLIVDAIESAYVLLTYYRFWWLHSHSKTQVIFSQLSLHKDIAYFITVVSGCLNCISVIIIQQMLYTK